MSMLTLESSPSSQRVSVALEISLTLIATCKDKGQATVGTQNQSPQEVSVNKM